jgi:NAD(P)H-hydrate epimerase
MIELPSDVYTAQQVRALDRTAIEVFGIPGYELMCRAGEASLQALSRHWPSVRSLTILCGAGNNAGDGYVLARLAAGDQYAVRVLSAVPTERLEGDAARAHADWQSSGGQTEAFTANAVLDSDAVVDALIGTGLDRPLDGTLAAAVDAINAAGKPVLALDLPTGLNADTGLVMGTAVEASATITFVGLKLGLFLGAAPDLCGELEFSDLSIPRQVYDDVTPPLRRLTAAYLRDALPSRRRSAHKGNYGSLLLVGGHPGMSGAIRLAAEAALRAGAGLVRVATHPDSVSAVSAGRPEIMCHAVGSADDLAPLLRASTALVLGPGLGLTEWSRGLWFASLSAGLPTVIDADGLNLLAQTNTMRGDWVLTPHPGEAARLLERNTAAVQGARLDTVHELADRYASTIVLKGAGSLIAAPATNAARLCDRGNPGMATAGMGDVLAGVIGALRAQGVDAAHSAAAGVYLHAAAGDDAAADGGERGLIASDLVPFIRRWANPV